MPFRSCRCCSTARRWAYSRCCSTKNQSTWRCAANALDDALHPIRVALRLRLPTDAAPQPQPAAEPVEDLVLQLSDPSLSTRPDGSRRARARARLVHEPATPGQRAVHSARFALEAPQGVVEADDLRWYLEHYAVWPSPLLAGRAQRVEAALEAWGRQLYAAALPAEPVAEVLKSWAAATGGAVARRFSVEVDASADAGTPADQVNASQEAATALLGLPWELLHDGRSHWFEGARPVRVRRRLPNLHPVAAPVLATPIRVLLASPRPEDDACSTIDHRASAGPMVDAMEALAGRVDLHLLTPPTLPALRDALARAKSAGTPYHVLHFDGHGVYDRRAGLGALCFEHPDDGAQPRGRRRHSLVPSNALGALLRDHGVALVVLEACQTAQAEGANESVASALLHSGVGSVVAMSHSVLVETSRRFVEAFYGALSRGDRVGGAMLAGQRALKDNPVRGRVFGHGDFTLSDWFVPVLYQDRDDPQLFRDTPPAQTREDWRARLNKRLGEVPAPPPQGFVGRSRELLDLERLLAVERYALLRGQGGEGKTELAAEFARWRVRARQVRRAAFVSVETHGHAAALLDAIGRQLVGAEYSIAGFATLNQAAEPVLRELRERATLLVIDNLESVLASPFVPRWVPPAPRAVPAADGDAVDGAADARDADDADDAAAPLLALAAKLLAAGDTRIVFTSREALPAPFDGAMQCIALDRLSTEDAVQLVERTLGLDGAGQGRAAEAQRGDIAALVDAVHGHVRTLALLAPALRERGAAATQADLVALLADMERRFPGQREHSLLASVELSLRRLPPDLRERARVLAVFHGGVQLDMLRQMTGWNDTDVQALGDALVATGLATAGRYRYLSLNPALCPYLAAEFGADDFEALASKWTAAMLTYVEFLRQEQFRNAEVAAALTLQDQANLMALLARVQHAGDAEATIALTTTLHQQLQLLNRPRLMERIAQARDAASLKLAFSAWSHARFQAERTRIEQLAASGLAADALAAARGLYQSAQAAGDAVYAYADHDLAMACLLLGQMLGRAGQPDAALPLLDEAQQRYDAVERRTPGCGADRMASAAVTERADALTALGRLDEAAQGYEQAIAADARCNYDRSVAVGKFQLGTVRRLQRRFDDALVAYQEALDRIDANGDAGSVATAWHQIGMVYQDADNGEAAEKAYRQSLAIKVQRGDVAGQASTLGQLGNLYVNLLGRPEDAVIHYRQAADRFVALQDVAGEGRVRNNLAVTLRRLGRLDDARREVERAIACDHGLGHAAEPWAPWSILAKIEADAGRPEQSREAWTQARDAYQAYRRDGGENHSDGGRVAAEVGRLLCAGDHAEAHAQLQQLAAHPNLPAWLTPLVTALQAITSGQRDASVADAPGLDFDDAAEILLLLDTLDAAGR